MKTIDVTHFDSPMIAARNRAALDINRVRAIALAEEALEIVAAGEYVAPSGGAVAIRALVDRALAGKVSLPPEAALPRGSLTEFEGLTIAIRNQTTLEAARALLDGGKQNILALNFASPTHPGAGFRTGGRAQEESLARSSALYATLIGDPMYAHHARRRDPISSAWAILSPDVPVFRHDDGALPETPYLCAFLTCAAPVARHLPAGIASAPMRRRIHRVLDIARSYGYTTLILGAWGCGVFGNNPTTVANDFRDALLGDFAGNFETIVFAITDWSPDRRYLAPFAAAFSATV